MTEPQTRGTATLDDDMYRYDADEEYERDAFDPVRDAHKYDAAVIGLEPLHYYKLDEGRGDFIDSAGLTVLEVGEHDPED